MGTPNAAPPPEPAPDPVPASPAVPHPDTAAGHEGLAALLAHPERAVVALDFDGTLADIVPDPTKARAHPGARAALARLAPHLRALAVITGDRKSVV